MSAVAAVGRKHPVHGSEVEPRLRHQGRQDCVQGQCSWTQRISCRFEFDMQTAKSPQNEARDVLRLGLISGQPQASQAPEQDLQGHLELTAGQHLTDAPMDSVTESHVTVGVATLHVELPGLRENRSIPIRCRLTDIQLRAARKIHTTEAEVSRDDAKEPLDRALKPERLLDERLDQSGICADEAANAGSGMAATRRFTVSASSAA